MTTLKSKLSGGQVTVGSWLSLPSTVTAEIMLEGGFDFLVIDREHTSIGTEAMAAMIQVVDLGGGTPLVRVGANDPLLIKHALDCGAKGVVVPMVCSAEDARRAVAAAYYPPRGQRGVGLFRAQGYGRSFDAYREWAERETVVVVQIEHIDAVDALEDILAVDGVDAFMIGPYDLSGSVGTPGDFAGPRMAEALRRIAGIMARSTKPGGLHVVHPDPQALKDRIGEGYRFLAYGVDQIFLSTAIDRDRATVKAINQGK